MRISSTTAIMTPGFDDVRGEAGRINRSKCIWIMEATYQHAVLLVNFDLFDLKYNPRCKDEGVQIYAQNDNSEKYWEKVNLIVKQTRWSVTRFEASVIPFSPLSTTVLA